MTEMVVTALRGLEGVEEFSFVGIREMLLKFMVEMGMKERRGYIWIFGRLLLFREIVCFKNR